MVLSAHNNRMITMVPDARGGKLKLSKWHVTARACAATHLLVRQVALNSACVFLPIMPPAMVSGMVMSAQINKMITMVPNGSAAVDCTQQLNQQYHLMKAT